MTTPTLEFLTDAELQGATGGGIGSAFKGIASSVGKSMVKHPDKWADAATTVYGAATSKDQLQNLQLGIA